MEYCHNLGVCAYRRAMDLLARLYTPLWTTSYYSAIASLHILQIATAPAKPFSSLLWFQQPFHSNGF
jgi:hypothetical protein